MRFWFQNKIRTGTDLWSNLNVSNILILVKLIQNKIIHYQYLNPKIICFCRAMKDNMVCAFRIWALFRGEYIEDPLNSVVMLLVVN